MCRMSLDGPWMSTVTWASMDMYVRTLHTCIYMDYPWHYWTIMEGGGGGGGGDINHARGTHEPEPCLNGEGGGKYLKGENSEGD